MTIVETSVDFARFDNMRRMEETGFFGAGALRPKDPDDAESFKVRKGRIGGYREELSDADLAAGFRRFLSDVTAGEAPTPERLQNALGADWAELDRRFSGFARRHATPHRGGKC